MDHYLIYNEHYEIIICKACGYAVKKNWIKKHLERKHKYLDIKVRKELVECTKELVESELIQTPEANCRAIEGLKLMNGFECEECGYVYVEARSIQEHCRSNHEWKKVMGIK